MVYYQANSWDGFFLLSKCNGNADSYIIADKWTQILYVVTNVKINSLYAHSSVYYLLFIMVYCGV